MGIEYIESQLNDGYLDLGLHDQEELQIISEALRLWKEEQSFREKFKKLVVCTRKIEENKE